jgi:hypothetical protein
MENRQDVPIAELISRIRFDVSTIIRKEIDIVKVEMSERMRRMVKDAAMIVVGGVVLFLGIQVLIATAIIALAHAVPLWLSALIVGVVLFVTGGAAAVAGIGRIKKIDWMPRKSLKLFREDISWLKKQVA